MAELKTRKNDLSVRDYLNAITDPRRKEDCLRIYAIMKESTGDEGSMWGESIIGFGSYHYVYASGREGDWMLTGFSNRVQSITIYIMSGFKKYEFLLNKLGKYKTGKSCLYIKSIDDIDEEVLKNLISESVAYLREKYS
ncbi:DUF1801 domain-containing protein [Balneola sp. MJW-20]|uniref:DUF1801 domain-containing protein n=1 Tax=Gracilimonas aurantiaca TaxID=3234185 RepID=UPI003466C943